MVGKQWCANVPIWQKELPQRTEHQSLPKSIRAAPQTCRESGSCQTSLVFCVKQRSLAASEQAAQESNSESGDAEVPGADVWRRDAALPHLLFLHLLFQNCQLLYRSYMSRSPMNTCQRAQCWISWDFPDCSRGQRERFQHICPLKARAVKSTGTKSWLHQKENTFSKSQIR